MSLLVLSITSVFTAAGPVMETETALMAVMRARRCVRREQSVRWVSSSVVMGSVYLSTCTVMGRSIVRMAVIIVLKLSV